MNTLRVPEKCVLLLADLDRAATVLRDQHLVARAHTHRYALAILVESAGTDGQDTRLVEVLDARLGQEDAAGGLSLGPRALDNHAVEKGDERLDRAKGRLLQLCTNPVLVIDMS